MKKRHKILVIRLDRLGDVMMALPVLHYLREQLPDADIDFLVNDLYVSVVGPYLHSIRVGTRGQKIAGKNPITKDYTSVLTLFADSKMALKAWRAQIPVRVGLFSKPWSFLLYSNGLRQKRSLSEQNEAVYNLELAQFFLKQIKGTAPQYLNPQITLSGDARSVRKAHERLSDIGMDSHKPFILFHPGMGGSAVNPSAAKYLEMIDAVEKTTRLPVVVSIGPVARDQELAATILQQKPYLKVIRLLELPVLREIFRLADTVVAPSTGPLHLAHYVGTKTVGIYPPVRAQDKKRWQPWGGTGKSVVFAPTLGCPGKRDCIGPKCQQYFCMDKLDWTSLILGKESSLSN